MDPEAKQCGRCGRKLRVDNMKGVCGDAKKCAARGGGGVVDDKSVYDVKAPSERTSSKKGKQLDVLKRFRIVAAALDEDPDALLEAFAQSWLEQLKERIE